MGGWPGREAALFLPLVLLVVCFRARNGSFHLESDGNAKAFAEKSAGRDLFSDDPYLPGCGVSCWLSSIPTQMKCAGLTVTSWSRFSLF
jgi:hypothetical protein